MKMLVKPVVSIIRYDPSSLEKKQEYNTVGVEVLV